MTLLALLACRSELTPPEQDIVPADSGVEDTDDPLEGCDQPEVCNGVDDDCDGLVDDADDSLVVLWFSDADGDTFGGEPLLACDRPAGSANRDGDCGDLDPNAHPLGIEVCHNGIDEDCDGFDDCRLTGLLDVQDLPLVTLTRPEENYCGEALLAPGDLDGNGAPDLVVGCTLQGSPSGPGQFYYFNGPITADRPLESAEGILRGEHTSRLLGHSLASNSELWVGGERGGSVVHVFYGPLSGDADLRLTHSTPNQSFGDTLAAGEGLVGVGAPAFYENADYQMGRVYAYTDVTGEPDFWMQGEVANDHLGAQIGTADVNGDGLTDLLSSSSRLGLVVGFQGGEGHIEPDLVIEHATGMGEGVEGTLVVHFNEDVCVFLTPESGHYEPEDADVCVFDGAPADAPNSNNVVDSWWQDMDGGDPDLLLRAAGALWLYSDPQGNAQRNPWEARTVLTGAGGRGNALLDTDGDGLSDFAWSSGTYDDSDVFIAPGAFP